VDNPRYIRRMETRQAEFLVHKGVPLKLVETVGVYTASKAAEVREIFDEVGVELQVEVKSAWYY